MTTWWAAFSLSAIFVGWIGTTALAAHQVVITVSQLLYMISSGMAAAVAVRVSYFAGQKDYAAGLRGEVVCIGLGHRGKEAEIEWKVNTLSDK